MATEWHDRGRQSFVSNGKEGIMRKSKTFSRGVVPIAVAFAGLLLALVMRTGVESLVHAQSSHSAVGGAAMPQYDGSAALKLPEAYRQWVFVGSSLGLSYSEGQPGVEMFHETLMEPSAYQHFVDTGTFREGTMLALILHGTGEQVLPARHGRFAADVHGVEMAVKRHLAPK
jgi:Cytochrome P460